MVTWPTYIVTESSGWRVEDKLKRGKSDIGKAAVRTQDMTVARTSVAVRVEVRIAMGLLTVMTHYV